MTGFEPEDAARAQLYSLVARLLYDGADARLLKLIAEAEPVGRPGSALGDAWRTLARACSTAGEAEVRQEYEDLFLGPGQSEVTLYLNHYRPAAGRERVLVELRRDLALYGVQRLAQASEPEDHAAALFDLMRILVSRGTEESSLDQQQDVFNRYIAPSYADLCAAVSKHAAARFYRLVAGLAAAFLDLEREVFKVC